MVRVFLLLQSPRSPVEKSHCRLNESLLSDPVGTIEIEKAINNYFSLNDMEGVNPETRWVAQKATIRGKLIQISFKIRQAHKVEVNTLEKEFLTIRKQHKKDPKSIPEAKLDAARLKLNLALTLRAERSLHCSGA